MEKQPEYRVIPGYPGYRVGDDGTVWCCLSLGRKPQLTDTWRKLSTPAAGRGYPIVQLGRGNVRTVHTLVLLAFCGPPPVGQETRHLDGNKQNCQLTNLCYGTPAANAQDRIDHGTANGPTNPLKGTRHPHAKLTPSAIKSIRTMRKAGNTLSMIASHFEVNTGTISDVLNGKTWTHVT